MFRINWWSQVIGQLGCLIHLPDRVCGSGSSPRRKSTLNVNK